VPALIKAKKDSDEKAKKDKAATKKADAEN
jgi:hypothetical protein